MHFGQAVQRGAWVLATGMLLLAAACRKQAPDSQSPASGSAPPPAKDAYFKTHWQDESQFIVEAVATDLAEMFYFAKHHSLPQPKGFSVAATETASTYRAPHYRIEIKFGGSAPAVQTEINVDEPIWEPQVYDSLAAALMKSLGLARADAGSIEAEKALPLELLRAPTAGNIEIENADLSKILDHDFQSPLLHERSALLIGLLGLREHAGVFHDLRSLLCRMTAHLAVARSLRPPETTSVHGQVADVLLSTLMNNQTEALRKLALLETDKVDLKFFVRSLKARNNLDYRALKLDDQATFLERANWCYAHAEAVDADLAWNALTEKEREEQPDFCRIINSVSYSVETGHQLAALSVPLELAEIQGVYKRYHGSALQSQDLIQALNRLPERCFQASASDPPAARVIGWGHWAMFLQRQLCHAVEQNFHFLQRKYGVPEEAKSFSERCDKLFDGLRLYPFVRRFNCTESQAYHRSLDDGFVVTVTTPHLVSPECWNYLCYTGPKGELYRPVSNPHVNEWHKHNPPPGTAYDPLPRMNHPSLVQRRDTVQQVEKLHDLAPFDKNISFNLVRMKYKGNETFAQVEEIYRPLLDYSSEAMTRVAEYADENPAEFEKISVRAARLDPAHFFALARYFAGTDDSKAAKYYEKGLDASPDAVVGAHNAPWLVKYYLRAGQREKARKFADWAAEVYSHNGLLAKAEFLELTGKPTEAYEWHQKIIERYQSGKVNDEILSFCYRQRRNPTYEKLWRAHSAKLFPRGFENGTAQSIENPPQEGVVVQEENRILRQSGLEKGDVIVAVYNSRVRNLTQYMVARNFSLAPTIDLLVWRRGQFHEFKVSPPEHTFGVKFGTYTRSGASTKQ